VLRDTETFSSTSNMAAMGPFMGEIILGMDGQEHRRYRTWWRPRFGPPSSSAGTPS
jgi:cytochrome P450